jgi:uncharacterized membrane protein
MAAFVFVTFLLLLVPLVPILGTAIVWGLLPFLMLALWALFFALQRNHKALQITEVLTLSEERAHLVRTDPKGKNLEWEANRYWTRVTKYDAAGPVPNYVTLKGANREVEIGAFLSEDERIALYSELKQALSHT